MLSKFTPDTVTVLMFVPVVAMVNDTVAVTLVAAITLLESTTEEDVIAALKIAGNVTDATVSIPALLAAKVEMVTPVVAAAAAAAFLSPANRHTIDEAVAVAGVVTLSTRVLEPDSDAVPAERPLQVREPVG